MHSCSVWCFSRVNPVTYWSCCDMQTLFLWGCLSFSVFRNTDWWQCFQQAPGEGFSLLFWDFSFPVNDSVYNHQLSGFSAVSAWMSENELGCFALGSLIRSDLYGKGELEISGSRAVIPDWGVSRDYCCCLPPITASSFQSFPKEVMRISLGFLLKKRVLFFTQ